MKSSAIESQNQQLSLAKSFWFFVFVPVLHRITAQSIPSSKIYCNTFQNQMPGGWSEVTKDMLRGARTKP